jgi:tetratricopeptide (TPR) repeat protein
MRAPIWIAAVSIAAAPSLALAKKDPAQVKASASADLAKIAGKVEAARKAANGHLADGDCKSFGKSFADVSKDNKIAEGWFNAGVLAEECGHLDDAEADYKNALDINGNFAPAMVNLGEIYYRQNKPDAAATQFERANKADPKNSQAYTDSALLLFDKATKGGGDTASMKEAVGKLRRALALDADSIAAYSLLALIYYTTAESDRSKLDLAELVCKQAKEVNDKYPQIYNTNGLIKLRKKNPTGALADFRKAAELDPAYVEAQLNIGAITLSARDYKSAEGAFKAALDAKPTDRSQQFDATIGMGVALRGQRRIDEAEKWYAKAKEVDARSCAVAYNLGVLYQDYKSGSEGDLKQAEKLFNEFNACGKAEPEKLKDSTRRIKDIEDTFKAMAEAKKLEEENKKMQEEMEKMQKEQEKQMQQQNPAGAGAPAGGAAPPADAKGGDAKAGDAKPADAKPADAKPADKSPPPKTK